MLSLTSSFPFPQAHLPGVLEMGQSSPPLEDQITEISKKLDALISFFCIGTQPRRNVLELRRWAEKTAEKIRDKDHGRPSKK